MNISLDKHHPLIRDITQAIHNRTNSEISTYHLALCAYFIAQVPSAFRVKVETPDGDAIPVNIYSIALADSGFGKGYALNLMENQLLKPFREKYEEEFMPAFSDCSIELLSSKRASKKGIPEDEEYQKLTKELASLGPYTFTFDSGTSPALKQLRQRLLLTGTGSLNLQMDEMGSHLEGNNEILQVFLELYDNGFTKVKLIKESTTQSRYAHIPGSTPANMLLFGTPAKVFDGAGIEKAFMNLLEIGYARRTLFGYTPKTETRTIESNAELLYQQIRSSNTQKNLENWSEHLCSLVDTKDHGKIISLHKDQALQLLEYRIQCEQNADRFSEFKSIEKSEMQHRYFKALKLAGTYAFINKEDSVTTEALQQAITLVEECGSTFTHIINREPNYVRLAKYLMQTEQDQYPNELQENLPFFKGSQYQKNELIELATAWGYRNGILIKRGKVGEIEYFNATGIKNTNLDELRVSYSNHVAYGYINETIRFDQLEKLIQTPDYHWINHHVQNQHRSESHVIPGFNLLVLDVDGGVTPNEIKQYLSPYTYLLNLTKRHTDEEPRFRLILPLAQEHEMTSEEYKEFSEEIFQWLPFEVDRSSNQRSKKWLCSTKGVIINKGKLLDTLQFIPQTKKGMEYGSRQKKICNLPRLERWVINQAQEGNRNNILYRYCKMLMDTAMEPEELEKKVKGINESLDKPLNKEELSNIIKQAKQP